MQRTKNQWIEMFQQEAEKTMPIALKLKNRRKKSDAINKAIKKYQTDNIEKVKREAKIDGWTNEQLLNEILFVTYASYIVMLEYRSKVWPYEYMAFARRIGELWEPFCKLPFEFPVKKLKLIEPHDFKKTQAVIRKKATDFISNLNVTNEEKRILTYYYNIPWSLVESGGIKLKLDLHFEQDGIRYNCDFKSGFNSNEKGNANRLLLVGSIYQSLGDNERTLLFVRQEEDQNNHYLQTLKNSPYWSCFCADACYAKMAEFTGFNLRDWLDKNVDWKNDISTEFRKYLEDNDLISYLTW